MNNSMTEYLLKHSKKKDKELKYDFMPSMLEIIERPAHKGGTVIIIGIFSLLIVAVIWACLSKTDVVVTASGSVQPVGNLNVVKSYSGGTVKSIQITEGAYVEKGDLLIELDTQALEIDENQLNSQKKLLESQQEVYTKIKDGNDLSEINIDEYDVDLKSSIQAILDSDTSYKNTLESLEKDKVNSDLNLQIAEIQLEQYKENGTIRQIKSQELMVQQYKLALEQIDVKIKDTKTQYSMQINAKLGEIGSQLNEIESSLEKYRLSKEYQNITAPVSGYINKIAVNTIGETVSTAQELITIVPIDAEMEMICYVKNMDIADIEVGDEAEIKLEAYPYNKYGTVSGTITYISPSAFINEQMGSVYLVKINPENISESIDIMSGLTGMVEIKTNKRSVMEYFLDPIIKGFDESLKEK